MSEFFKIHKSELLHILSCAIGASYTNVDDAIERMKLKTVALAAEQQQQEPVAKQYPDIRIRLEWTNHTSHDVKIISWENLGKLSAGVYDLYTHPQTQVQGGLLVALHKISLTEADATSSAAEKVRDMTRIARAAIAANSNTEQPRAAVPDGWKIEVFDRYVEKEGFFFDIVAPDGKRACCCVHAHLSSQKVQGDVVRRLRDALAAAPAQPGEEG